MKTAIAGMALAAAAACWFGYVVHSSRADAANEPPLSKAGLGAMLFAEPALSEPAGQACASCHDPKRAFSDPRNTSTSEGAIKGRRGPRNAPSIVYASFTPPLSKGGDEGGYTGGFFWDGRAHTLEDQLTGPLLNPLEMNNADAAMILRKLEGSKSAPDFLRVYGPHALDDATAALSHLAEAIAAYESSLPNRFTSKYDAYLAGTVTLSPSEMRGLRLFENPKTGPCTQNPNGTMSPPCGCAQCHLDRPGANGEPPLFTDFGYDNIGIPHNPDGPDGLDEGLAATTHEARRRGQFKAPTLRNVAVTAPYGHNGYFKTVKEVIDFYNTRDFAGAWSHPEEPRGINHEASGTLHLTDDEETDMVAFLETLTDGYVAR